MIRRWFVLNVNPVPWRVGPAGAKRGAKGIHAYVGRDQEVYAYQQAIKEELERQVLPEMIEGKISITMWFWRNLPEYQSDKKKAKNQEADGTNLYKATEDALQGILFKNDRTNISGHWHIVDQGPDAPSRVIISIESVSPTHIDDIQQLIPDEVFEEAFPGGQMTLDFDRPNTEMDSDGSKYAEAPPIF